MQAVEMDKARAIGHIEDVIPGSVFHRRKDVLAAKLHGDNQRGISTLRDADGKLVADAIVLNGGYDDDEDHWDWIRYTGAGGQDADKNQVDDQNWEYRDNAALKLSFERQHPVRIIRGYKGDSRYSMLDDYRYDGLYEITCIRTASSKLKRSNGEAFKICQFDLQRLPAHQQELTVQEQNAAALFDPDSVEKFPETRTTIVERIVRDSAVVRRVKQIHNHECQICGFTIVGGGGQQYSEGAHIRPLGRQHRGPDVESNVLCLCPNCHVRLDNGAIYITDEWVIVDRTGEGGKGGIPRTLTRRTGHPVEIEYIRYHRNWWNDQLASTD
jgi:predicted restriction endonuclease